MYPLRKNMSDYSVDYDAMLQAKIDELQNVINTMTATKTNTEASLVALANSSNEDIIDLRSNLTSQINVLNVQITNLTNQRDTYLSSFVPSSTCIHQGFSRQMCSISSALSSVVILNATLASSSVFPLNTSAIVLQPKSSSG